MTGKTMHQRQEHAREHASAVNYRAAIVNAIGILEGMPNIDYDADPDDPSPEDAVAHVTGLALRVLRAAIGEDGGHA